MVVPYKGQWSLVWGLDRKVYIADESTRDAKSGRIGHATFFGGKPVLFPGEMYVNHYGVIEWISNRSGNYMPNATHFVNFYKFLRDDKGVNVAAIEWRTSRDGIETAVASDWFDRLEASNH